MKKDNEQFFISKEKIIKYWKLGYSVNQITDMSEIVKKSNNDKSVRHNVQNWIEKQF